MCVDRSLYIDVHTITSENAKENKSVLTVQSMNNEYNDLTIRAMK